MGHGVVCAITGVRLSGPAVLLPLAPARYAKPTRNAPSTLWRGNGACLASNEGADRVGKWIARLTREAHARRAKYLRDRDRKGR